MVVPSSGRARRSTDIFDPPLERHAASLLEDRPRRDALLSYTSYAMVAIGAALRLTQYLTNRSLSFDEALLALNIIQKSPRALLGELSFDQAAPLGFLEAEKLATAIFGRSEYALRLFPLLVSLLSLVAFYWAARKLLNGIAVPLALAAFALLEPLIYYSATAKQYAIDVAVAVLLFGIGAALRSSRLDTAALMMLTATGAVAVWFSHASVFVLAPLGLLLAYQAFRGGDRNRFLQLRFRRPDVVRHRYGAGSLLLRARGDDVRACLVRPAPRGAQSGAHVAGPSVCDTRLSVARAEGDAKGSSPYQSGCVPAPGVGPRPISARRKDSSLSPRPPRARIRRRRPRGDIGVSVTPRFDRWRCTRACRPRRDRDPSDASSRCSQAVGGTQARPELS